MSDRELTLTRIFDAPRELVFRAWTDPDQYARWLGPRGYEATAVTINLRPGGRWRTCIRSGADGIEQWSSGTYREIVEPERLVFTFAWESGDQAGEQSLVTVTFGDLGGKTELRFHQAAFSTVAARDRHRGGWASSFDRLVEFLTRQGD
jgi:uncharacterized protein YndB with AHSA1/START domain